MPQDSPIAVWDITIPQKNWTVEQLHELFHDKCKKYAFQLEKGEQTDYMHYQCRISLHKKVRLSGLLKMFEKIGHFSPTSNEGSKGTFYVMKDQTRVDGPWTDKNYDPPRRQLKTVTKMLANGLYPWQQSLIDITKEYDDRTIHIVIDHNGNTGKSSLCKMMWQLKIGQPIPPMQTAEDIVQFVKSLPINKLYLIDMPRAMKKNKLYGLYSGIETIKNGMLYDKRYKGQFEYIDEPNIIVFTNSPPKMKYLSHDRWNLWTVKDKHLVEYKFTHPSSTS